jgi:hypothetical protein
MMWSQRFWPPVVRPATMFATAFVDVERGTRPVRRWL